jgi:glycosyltransferase involved in cell wall biosynthesis
MPGRGFNAPLTTPPYLGRTFNVEPTVSDSVRRPKISLCIPTRSRRLFLARHLRHIANTFKTLDYEVVISDNCSTDDTPDVVEAFRPELKSVVYVRQPEPLNFFETQVAVMNSAGGEYAICSADDDLLVEAGLLRAVEVLDNDPSVSAAYGGWEGWSPNQQEMYYKAVGVEVDTRVRQRDLIHWFLNANTPELPIIRTDLLHRSHLPVQHQYGFDFYGAALLTRFGDLMMIPDTVSRVTMHADQESQNLYRADILQCYLADYELFFAQFAPMRPGIGAQLVTHVLARQYFVAAERALGRGHYVLGRDLLMRARTYMPADADARLAAAWERYRLHYMAESVSALARTMHPVERIMIEQNADAMALRNLISGMLPEQVVVVGSREEILKVRPQVGDFVVGNDAGLQTALSERAGIWLRRFRTFEALERAARFVPSDDISIEDFLDEAALLQNDPPQTSLIAGAAS